jgi:RNA-binding motif X-linked protein 2
MNNVRNVEKINEEEFKLGIFGGLNKGSWHDEYRKSAWIFIGGLSYELSEGDVICVFSQWGEVEDLHLIREKDTQKPKGFAFLKYEDCRSCICAVDNFNGSKLLGRVLRVDHVDQYKLPKEIQEEENKKLEAGDAELDIGPGHAYRNKQLANKYSIHKGVNVWSQSAGAEEEEEEGEDSEDSRKDKKKKVKKEKKQKVKKEREEKDDRHDKKKKQKETDKDSSDKKKRKRDHHNHHNDHSDSDDDSRRKHSKKKKEKKEDEHKERRKDDDHHGKKKEKRIKEEKEEEDDEKYTRHGDEEDEEQFRQRQLSQLKSLQSRHFIPYQSSLPEGVVASWRGVRDPELHKTAEAYEMKKQQMELREKQRELFPNTSSSSGNPEEITGMGGSKRIR